MRRYLPSEPITLNQQELDFLAEVVFLLKTFFFVYVGVSIRFTDRHVVLAALLLTAIIFVIRIPAVWLGLDRTTPVRDAALAAIMSPKGLAAVVLASMPLERKVAGGLVLQSTTYCVVFVSIVLTSLLSFLVERTRVGSLYEWFFRRTGFGRGVIDAQSSVSSGADSSS